MNIFEEADKLMTENGWTFWFGTRRSGWGADARTPAQGCAGDFEIPRKLSQIPNDGDWIGGWVFGRTLEIALTKAIKRARGEHIDSIYAESDT